METQARFLAVGAATLAAALAAVAFLVWLAGAGPARDTRVYDIVFDGVAGLGVDADVLYSGLPVGRVTELALHEPDPRRVRARIEVLAETPVTEGTVAQLATQGVTGLASVALSGGSGEPLAAEAGEVPVIPSVRSPVQALFDETPNLLVESVALLREIQGFATPENQERVARILADLEGATAAVRRLAETAAPAAERIADASDALALAADDLRALSEPLAGAVASAEGAFDATAGAAARLDAALAAVEADLLPALPGLAQAAEATLALAQARLGELDGLGAAVAAVEGAGRGIEAAAREGLPSFVAQAQDASASLAALSADLATSLPRLVTRAEAAIGGAERSLDAVGRAATDLRGLTSSLDRLVRRVERDPAGFFLGGR